MSITASNKDLNLNIVSKGTYEIKVQNVLGRTAYKSVKTLDVGVYSIKDINVASGVYITSIKHNGITYTNKFKF